MTKPAAPSLGEETLALHIKADKLPAPLREHRFHPTRQWRFDFAWPEQRVAVEIEGWGRHQRRGGFEDDCDKYNEAAILGWLLLRFTTSMVRSGVAVRTVARALDCR